MLGEGARVLLLPDLPEGDLFMIRTFSLVIALLLAVVSPVWAVPAVTATVPISPRPVAVAVDGATHTVFVADVERGAVVLFDGGRGAVASTIAIGGQPSSLVVDDRGGRLFVGNRDPAVSAVTVVEIDSGRAQAFLPRGSRVQGLAFDSELNRLYAGDPDTNELLIVDGDSGNVLDGIPLGGVPVAVAVNERNGEVAAAVQGSAPALVLLDPTTNEVTTIAVPEGQPLHVDVDTSTGKFFVTRGGASPALLVLRPGSGAFDNAIPIAPGPTGLAIDSRTSRIYLAHATVSSTVIDGATGTPSAVLPLGDGSNQVSNHVAVDMASTPTRVYIVDTANGLLSVLTDQ
jgi:DNA-binding beta-propeller fold protein YncE